MHTGVGRDLLRQNTALLSVVVTIILGFLPIAPNDSVQAVEGLVQAWQIESSLFSCSPLFQRHLRVHFESTAALLGREVCVSAKAVCGFFSAS